MEQRSGRKRQGTDCEQEDGVTAANQISLSLGCLMSILLCDSHLTTPSTMNTRSTRASMALLLHSKIRGGGVHQNGTKTEEGGKGREGGERLRNQWGSFVQVCALRITNFSPLMLKYFSAQRICFSSSPTQSLSLSLWADCLVFCLCFYSTGLPPRLQRDSAHSSTSTPLKLKPSTVRINCLALA